MSALDLILEDPPKVHAGGKLTWSLSEDVLRFIEATLPPDAHTLETGAGMSTLLFALTSQQHTCVVHGRAQVRLLRAYAKEKNIPLDHVDFRVGRSEQILPSLELDGLDMVLIDGGHGFPIPALDWFYTAPMIKPDGIVILDDVQIWSGSIVKQFLKAEPDWRLVKDFASRSVAFSKVGAAKAKDWSGQPFVVRKSRVPRLVQVARAAAGLLMRGEFRTLQDKVAGFRRHQTQRRA